MTHVYVLQHVHAAPNGEEDVKLIGVYATEADAQAALSRLSRSVLPEPGIVIRSLGGHVERLVLGCLLTKQAGGEPCGSSSGIALSW
jgi:hypothetical protein